jgi:PGF-CTERM protein
VTPGEITVSGTSNREDETEVFVEVIDADNQPIASSSAEVDGSTSSWETTIDMSGVSPGQYTVRAEDDQSTAERDFQLAESTPTATPEDTPTPEDDTPTEEPDTDTPTEEPDTDTPTEEPDTPTEAQDTPMEPDTETTTTGPGFGIIVGILALLGAGLLATRRRE